MGTESVAEAKRRLRGEVDRRRRGMTTSERARHDAVILAGVVGIAGEAALRRGWEPRPGEKAPVSVCAYVPSFGEAGGAELPLALASAVERVLLPVTPASGPLDWAEFTPATVLSAGRFGIPEPTGPRLGAAAIAQADVVVVPAVACDERGFRLGRGGGYYDQTLRGARADAVLACVLDSADVLPEVPVEEHDIPVHVVVSETGMRWFAPPPGFSPAHHAE